MNKAPKEVAALLRDVAEAIEDGRIPWDADVVCTLLSVLAPGRRCGSLKTELKLTFDDCQPYLRAIAYAHGTLHETCGS